MELNLPKVSEEQLQYAKWLDAVTRVGFVVLIATFFVYASGVSAPHVPFADLPRYWALPVGEYLAATGGPVGWGWLGLVGRGDYMNFVGIALLAALTALCYVRLSVTLILRRDMVGGLIAVAEIAVLIIAASGLAGSAH